MVHCLYQSTLAIPQGGYKARFFFFQWFLHFIKHTKLTKEDPVILVLDRHYSHTRNLEDISSVPSLNLKPNPHSGTAKKIMSSSFKKFVEATQKKKTKLTTKSKINQLASYALLGPSKR
jgi:hypothetical protein